MHKQSQDLSLLLLQGWIAWLCWACIFWFCIISWLGMLSFLSFPFIVFFLQVFWSKFAILFKFFSKKTNHFWATPSTLFLSLVPLSPCSLHVFVSLQIFLLLFFSFIEFLFFVLYIRLSFLSICFGSAFIFVKSPCKVFKKLQRALHPLGHYLWHLVLLLTCIFFSWRQ